MNPLHDPEARKELSDHLAWLWEEVRMALVALGKAREAVEALEEEDRLERAHARAQEVLEPAVREEA